MPRSTLIGFLPVSVLQLNLVTGIDTALATQVHLRSPQWHDSTWILKSWSFFSPQATPKHIFIKADFGNYRTCQFHYRPEPLPHQSKLILSPDLWSLNSYPSWKPKHHKYLLFCPTHTSFPAWLLQATPLQSCSKQTQLLFCSPPLAFLLVSLVPDSSISSHSIYPDAKDWKRKFLSCSVRSVRPEWNSKCQRPLRPGL